MAYFRHTTTANRNVSNNYEQKRETVNAKHFAFVYEYFVKFACLACWQCLVCDKPCVCSTGRRNVRAQSIPCVDRNSAKAIGRQEQTRVKSAETQKHEIKTMISCFMRANAYVSQYSLRPLITCCFCCCCYSSCAIFAHYKAASTDKVVIVRVCLWSRIGETQLY